MTKFSIYFESMAGTHHADAVRALRDAGSSDSLYEPSLRATGPGEIAEGERVGYSRRALLFAAFAAEAYANDFLYARFEGQDRDALQKLSTVDKYALLPSLTGASTTLDRGGEPLQQLTWLSQRRAELVHAVPRGRDLTYDPANHNPLAVAESIVAVAVAAAAMTETAPDGSVLSHILAERPRLLEYGKHAAARIPAIHDDPSPTDLLAEARRRHWRSAGDAVES